MEGLISIGIISCEIRKMRLLQNAAYTQYRLRLIMSKYHILYITDILRQPHQNFEKIISCQILSCQVDEIP